MRKRSRATTRTFSSAVIVCCGLLLAVANVAAQDLAPPDGVAPLPDRPDAVVVSSGSGLLWALRQAFRFVYLNQSIALNSTEWPLGAVALTAPLTTISVLAPQVTHLHEGLLRRAACHCSPCKGPTAQVCVLPCRTRL